MDAYRLLMDLAVVLAAALCLGFVFYRLKQPVIIGYLIGGLVIGPYGLKFVSDLHTIETFAELGVILLMFALGVEFSFSELKPVKKIALYGGSAQILVTIGVAALASRLLGLGLGAGILLGCMISLSSTLIVLKTLLERGEIQSAHGKALLGLLVVQDLAVVPFMVVMPNLSDPAKILGWPMLFALAKAAVFLGAVVYLGAKLFPMLMRRVALTRNKELFLLAAIFVCFGTAVISNRMGLSLALGAFIAGIVVSESDHSHQILADVLPLRDLFATLFFVSTGMLINPAFIATHLPSVAGFAIAIVLLKAALGFGIARLFRYSGRTALGIGLGLAQLGEFSFVLAKMGQQQGIISADLFALVLSSALVTILLTPTLMQAATPLYLRLRRLPLFGEVRGRKARATVATAELTGLVDHVVICGFGRLGQNVCKVLVHHQIPIFVIDVDQNALQELSARNIPCMYGDAANVEVLKHARLPLARAMLVALSDPTSCQLALKNAKALNPKLNVQARAHRPQDVDVLYDLGADEVVQPEFEASIEVIRYTLSLLGYPSHEILRYSHQIRTKRYRQFEDAFDPTQVLDLVEALGEAEITWVDIPEGSPLNQQSLRDIDLRGRTGVGVLAVRHAGRVSPNPDADQVIRAGDSLLVMGMADQLSFLTRLLSPLR
ncbi:MAG TPA: cation:proton antiporter [Pantanalinema sp.]